MNQIVIIGRLTKDPELRYTESNSIPFAVFTVAVDRPPVKDREKQTDFIPVTTWRVLAENCSNYLSKGKLVAVRGRLEIDSYKDRDGNNRRTFNVVANQVKFLERVHKEQTDQQADHGFTGSETEEDAVPF